MGLSRSGEFAKLDFSQYLTNSLSAFSRLPKITRSLVPECDDAAIQPLQGRFLALKYTSRVFSEVLGVTSAIRLTVVNSHCFTQRCEP